MRNLVLVLLGFLSIVLLAAAATAAPLSESAAAEARAEALRKTSEQLVCQCGCNMILSECSHQNCPFALPERERILALIDAGKTPSEIVAIYVSESGRGILSAPPTNASLLDRSAWLVPIVALALGLVVVGLLAVRFTAAARARRVQPASTTPSPVASAVGDGYRARVARELESRSGGGP